MEIKYIDILEEESFENPKTKTSIYILYFDEKYFFQISQVLIKN